MNTNKPSGSELNPGILSEKNTMKSRITGPFSISISYVENYSSQPRKHFDAEALQCLADSIREHGIIQPIIVRKLPSGYYQIIAGERRWRAARIAGLREVPVIVMDADDRTAAELAMIENLQREDLNPIEEAGGYQDLMEQHHMTQEEISQLVGKSRPAVANAIRLLTLCPALRAMVEDGTLSARHARTLLPLSPALQEKTAAIVVADKLTVLQTEVLVKKLSAGGNTNRESKRNQIDLIEDVLSSLATRLGRSVKIVSGRKKGHIELEYQDLDDLNDLLDALAMLQIQKQID